MVRFYPLFRIKETLKTLSGASRGRHCHRHHRHRFSTQAVIIVAVIIVVVVIIPLPSPPRQFRIKNPFQNTRERYRDSE